MPQNTQEMVYNPDEVKWEPWMQTASGIKFRFTDRYPEEVDIGDIALVLSRMPRWAGHTNKFYAVGQHLINTAELVAELGGNLLDQQLGFAHDFTEAYLCDLPAPVKRLLPQYKELEATVWRKISKRFFGKVLELTELVRHCDGVMLTTEQRDLFDFEPIDDWVRKQGCPEPHPTRITPYGQDKVHRLFIEKYGVLFND